MKGFLELVASNGIKQRESMEQDLLNLKYWYIFFISRCLSVMEKIMIIWYRRQNENLMKTKKELEEKEKQARQAATSNQEGKLVFFFLIILSSSHWFIIIIFFFQDLPNMLWGTDSSYSYSLWTFILWGLFGCVKGKGGMSFLSRTY